MMTIVAQAALFISGALFDSLWEGALIVGLVWLGLRCLPRLGAATRYAIWLCALAALVLVPLATVSVPASPQRSAPASIAAPAGVSAPSALTNLPDVALPAAPSIETPQAPRIPVSQKLAITFALVWVLVAFARGALLAFNLFQLSTLRRKARVWSLTHDYPVLLSERARVPFAMGFLRPAVILPASLVEEQSLDALDAIVMHETSHLRRNDVWTNALARILEAFVALNPAAWFVLNRLATEREIACDDWVVARLGAGDVFARTLAAMANRAGTRAPFAAPSAVGSRHSLVARIERLLDARPRSLRLSLSALGGTLMLFALIAIVLQSVSPVLAYAPSPLPAQLQLASGCASPNRGIRMMMEIDRTASVERYWVGPADPSKYVRRLGASHIATVDLTVDAAGVVRKLAVVSAPSIPGLVEMIARTFMHETYEPALHDCAAITSTLRMSAYVGARGGPRDQTLSMVTPSYPAGWRALHPTSCKVPNVLHTGVPAFPASLRNESSTLTASVRVHVDAAGSVTGAAVVTPSGNASLDDAVLATARAEKYPMTETSGFKPVRPSHTSLAWNRAHGSTVYSKCDPLPSDYLWTTTATRDTSPLVAPLWSRAGSR